MNTNVLYLFCMIAASLPFAAIPVLLIHYCLRRAAWKRKQRRGQKSLGFCPSSSALGVALLFMQVFIRPSLQHVIEERQQEDVDEDAQGDPESPLKHLKRQLRKIRRGEMVGDLVLRL